MQTSLCTAVAGGSLLARAGKTDGTILFGLCASPGNAAKLKAIGYDFIEGGVGGSLKPNASDAEYAPELEKIKTCGLPMRSCNGFLPKELRLTGPDEGLRHDEAIQYAVKACKRADQVGLVSIVFGSGGARNAPDGFDIGKAREQFIAFCKKLGPAIADRKVTIVLEPLNKKEANFLTSVAEGIEMTDEIGHPRIQLLADFYHMMREDEGPDSIRKAGSRIRHCHIAELDGRKAPGAKGEDLSRFLKALRDIGYTGGVSCECGWPKENVDEAWQKALDTLRAQSKA